MSDAGRSGYVPKGVLLRRFDFHVRDGRTEGKLIPPEMDFSVKAHVLHASKEISVTANLTSKDPAGTRASFEVSAELQALYGWEEPLSLPVEKFAAMNAPAFLWPYARELIWNFTVRAGLPPLLLEILNFGGVQVEVTNDDGLPDSANGE